MSRTRDLAWLLILSMAAAAAALSARSRHRAPPVEAAPHAPAPAETFGTVRGLLPSPPKAREVREAIRRVFADAVAADGGRAVAGDFNGDGSEDLAVVARPGPGRLAPINHELANWTVQDAQAAPLDASGARRVTVRQADLLLAVIHGHGARGWRNPEARQSYLVRNAVGSQARPRVVEDGRGLARPGSPRLRGDVIVEGIPGRPGFVYWSGARYVWFPLASAGAR